MHKWENKNKSRQMKSMNYSYIRTVNEEVVSRITFPRLFLLLTSPMKLEQSVPKRRELKFRRRGITQKKKYNIQETAKVWNQE